MPGHSGWSPHPLHFSPVLPFRNGLVSRPWQISRGFPQILWDRYREGRRSGRENTLSDLEGSEEVVLTILSHAFFRGDRRSDSTFVSGTDLWKVSPSVRFFSLIYPTFSPPTFLPTLR